MYNRGVQRNPKRRTTHETDRNVESLPANGGARGYSQDARRLTMENVANGHHVDAVIALLQQQRVYPCDRTIRRWREREKTLGHYLPFEMNGNKPVYVMNGHMLFMLTLFRLCYPKATAAEVNAFLFDCTLPGMVPRFYTESQITNAENWLGISRKRGSTTAEQASLPINLQKRFTFWNSPHPVGIQGTSRSTIIDWDEAAIFLETTNRGFGKCHITTRVNEEGPYNHSHKYTLTAAIRGGANGGCWINFELRTGTTILDTFNFL